jgi:hypothetical protein
MIDANGVGGRYDSFHAQALPEVYLANSRYGNAGGAAGFFDDRDSAFAHPEWNYRTKALMVPALAARRHRRCAVGSWLAKCAGAAGTHPRGRPPPGCVVARLTDPANNPGPHHRPVKGRVALADNFFVDRVMIGGDRQQRQKRRYRTNRPVAIFPLKDRASAALRRKAAQLREISDGQRAIDRLSQILAQLFQLSARDAVENAAAFPNRYRIS